MELTWLLCNRCFIHLRETKSPFSLTQCGHLFCSKCIVKVANQCPVCKTHGVQTMCLTTPLQPMVRPMFEDIQTMAEKLVLAAKFQKHQLSMLEHREQELAKKYVAIKAGYWQLVEQYKKIAAEYDAVKTDYNNLIAQKSARVQPMFKPSRNTRVCFAQQNTIFGSNQPDSRNMFHPISSNNSEDSDGSSSTIRAGHSSKTPDNLFRVPAAMRIPRSTGSRSSRSGGSTPMSVEYERKSSSGYGSDANAYFRR